MTLLTVEFPASATDGIELMTNLNATDQVATHARNMQELGQMRLIHSQ